MNIFEEVKARVSARDVATHYGLKVNRNGMACCPFHDDKHPSMKIDKNHYHCFGCGAHGDATGFVAARYGLSQYDAACKINEDLSLGIDTVYKLSEKEKQAISDQRKEIARISDIKDRFQEWKRKATDDLLECERLIEKSEDHLMNTDPHVIYLSNGFVYMMRVKTLIAYWLDILCMGSEEEARDFFMTDGKEVGRIVANVKRAGETILGRNSKSA